MRYHKTYENFDEEPFPEREEVDLEKIEEQEKKKCAKHKNARKSIDEYLERKRRRRQYKDLFDDDFGDD